MKTLNKTDWAKLMTALLVLRKLTGLRVGISDHDELIINGFAICKIKKNEAKS